MNLPILPLALLGMALPALAITVTTTSNVVDPDDGETSLVEALLALQDGDTLNFEIPGDGPHYIETPVGGYPAITQSNITINGYSQPGAKANTATYNVANNADIRIVLDSRNGNKKTLEDYDADDFGDSESAILWVLDAKNVTIKGLAFIGRPGNDSWLDPNVYDIAFIRSSADGKVQGCWFGLDPAAAPFTPDANGVRPGIHPASSAIASFAKNAGDMIIGVNSPKAADARGEGNIFIGNRISVHLQQPRVRVAGNRFNMLPNGEIFDPADQWLDTDFEYYDSLESPIQNGFAEGMIIGTDGLTATKAAFERNYFGPVNYSCFMEFWGQNATNLIIAGNRVGVGLNDMPAYEVADAYEDRVSLIEIRAGSSVQLGSNYDNKSDASEFNFIHGLTGPLIRWHGTNSQIDKTPARISMRGNNMSNNFGTMPYDSRGGAAADAVFRNVIEPDAIADGFIHPRWEYDEANKVIRGEVPPAIAGATVGNPILDIYVGDGPTSVPQGAGYENGYPQGRTLFARMEVDGTSDQNPEPGKFEFKIADIKPAPSKDQFLHRVVLTANWVLASGEAVTSNFSPVLEQQAFGELQITSVKVVGSGSSKGLRIDWVGGYYPFKVQYAENPWGPWKDSSGGAAIVGGDHNSPTITTNEVRSKTKYFYRVLDNVTPKTPTKIVGPIDEIFVPISAP